MQPGPGKPARVAWCPQCGPLIASEVDGDGCCRICGADASGAGADKALAALARIADLRGERARIRRALADTVVGDGES